MDDVDNQTVGGGPKGQRPSGYQQGHHVEQVWQVGCNIQGIVEGQHEHVACQNGNVVPHQVLLQCGRWRQARLVYDLTHPTNNLPQRIGEDQTETLQTRAKLFISFSNLMITDGKIKHYLANS